MRACSWPVTTFGLLTDLGNVFGFTEMLGDHALTSVMEMLRTFAEYDEPPTNPVKVDEVFDSPDTVEIICTPESRLVNFTEY